MIGAAQRPITLGLSRPHPNLLKQRDEAEKPAPEGTPKASTSPDFTSTTAGTFAVYSTNAPKKMPVSSSPSVRLVTLPGSDGEVFSSIDNFDAISKNKVAINKVGGVSWTKKSIKAPLCHGIAKGNAT